jgi:GT2 family glycosyltransferase
MKIWICIPVFNRKVLTLKCLASLEKQIYTNFTIVICDHGSTDGTTEAIHKQYPNVIVINADNSLWWTGAINRCVEYVLKNAEQSDSILTLNDDTEVLEDYLFKLANNFDKYPNSIITSPIINIKTGSIVDIGYRFNWLLATSTPVNFEDHHLINDENTIEVTHATGRGTLFPIDLFKKIGLYDEKHLPHYGADEDLTFKATRAGFKIYVSKECPVLSYVEATGMTSVLKEFSLKSLLAYFTSMRSPANLKMRFWYGWNNCPKLILPIYIAIDFIRISGSYFKQFMNKH